MEQGFEKIEPRQKIKRQGECKKCPIAKTHKSRAPKQLWQKIAQPKSKRQSKIACQPQDPKSPKATGESTRTIEQIPGCKCKPPHQRGGSERQKKSETLQTTRE